MFAREKKDQNLPCQVTGWRGENVCWPYFESKCLRRIPTPDDLRLQNLIFERNLDNKYYNAGLYYTLIIHGNSYLLGEEISQYLLFFPLIRNIIGTGK